MNKQKQTFEDYEKIIRAARIPYRATLTNYTARIESEFLNLKDIGEEKSKLFFAAAAKIKADCKKKEKPPIDIHSVNFYKSGLTGEMYAEHIFGIDIKSAYATALKNAGYISEDTFKYIQKLRKLDRLGAIGMLAGNKKIFEFNERGEIISAEEVISETAEYFYFACAEVEKIMDEIRTSIPAEHFLFTWVDCIYITDDKSAIKAAEILLKNGYDYNPSFYSSMAARQRKKGLEVTLIEEKGETEGEKTDTKKFWIPPLRDKIRKDLEKYILLQQTAKK